MNAANSGFAGGGTFDTNGFTTTVTQSIQGAGALTKAGAGTLDLASDNSYSGGTTINAGTLQVGNGGATGGEGPGLVLDRRRRIQPQRDGRRSRRDHRGLEV